MSGRKAELPPELAGLDAELASLRIEERASFGPELEAELARRAAEPHAGRAGGGRTAGRIGAAAVTAVVMAVLVSSPVRASLARALSTLMPAPDPVPEVPASDPGSASGDDRATVSTLPEEPGPPAGEGEGAPAGRDASGSVPPGRTPFLPSRPTPPRLADERETAALLERFYPAHLQEAGVGGTVRLRLWVDPHGWVDSVRIEGATAPPELGRAAAEAARYIRFVPGRWRGAVVGTWVEVAVRFDPG